MRANPLDVSSLGLPGSFNLTLVKQELGHCTSSKQNQEKHTSSSFAFFSLKAQTPKLLIKLAVLV